MGVYTPHFRDYTSAEYFIHPPPLDPQNNEGGYIYTHLPQNNGCLNYLKRIYTLITWNYLKKN